MPLPTTFEQLSQERLSISLEPVRNALASMLAVVMEHVSPGTGTWLDRTRERLSAQEFARHKLVLIGFFHAILPDQEWPGFSEYLAALEARDATALRDRMLREYESICMACDESLLEQQVDWNEVLASVEAYLAFLAERFGEEHIEPELEKEAYRYVIDPPAMQKLIVEHLRWFWETHLAAEWSRAEPLLQASARAFEHANLDRMGRLEAARYITGQEVEKQSWAEALEKAERVVFVPNPHVGPYVTKLHFGTTLGVVFGARQPEDARERIPELDRADLAARMSAIADDTRLRILQLIGERGELRSSDIMEAFELSQPSASRYLTQLTATGYLQERRANGAKAYALNRERIEKTLQAVHNFLLGV